MKTKKTDKEVAEIMIKTMQDFGLNPDEMLKVLKLAKEKHHKLIKFGLNSEKVLYEL